MAISDEAKERLMRSVLRLEEQARQRAALALASIPPEQRRAQFRVIQGESK
jgi:hypothetical protein